MMKRAALVLTMCGLVACTAADAQTLMQRAKAAMPKAKAKARKAVAALKTAAHAAAVAPPEEGLGGKFRAAVSSLKEQARAKGATQSPGKTQEWWDGEGKGVVKGQVSQMLEKPADDAEKPAASDSATPTAPAAGARSSFSNLPSSVTAPAAASSLPTAVPGAQPSAAASTPPEPEPVAAQPSVAAPAAPPSVAASEAPPQPPVAETKPAEPPAVTPAAPARPAAAVNTLPVAVPETAAGTTAQTPPTGTQDDGVVMMSKERGKRSKKQLRSR